MVSCSFHSTSPPIKFLVSNLTYWSVTSVTTNSAGVPSVSSQETVAPTSTGIMPFLIFSASSSQFILRCCFTVLIKSMLPSCLSSASVAGSSLSQLHLQFMCSGNGLNLSTGIAVTPIWIPLWFSAYSRNASRSLWIRSSLPTTSMLIPLALIFSLLISFSS